MSFGGWWQYVALWKFHICSIRYHIYDPKLLKLGISKLENHWEYRFYTLVVQRYETKAFSVAGASSDTVRFLGQTKGSSGY